MIRRNLFTFVYLFIVQGAGAADARGIYSRGTNNVSLAVGNNSTANVDMRAGTRPSPGTVLFSISLKIT